ncbi:hypothetical protein BDZ91DRAFT_813214, partial [Kalaharituber pfeilii]
FNVSLERFTRNWKTAEVIIAVKDARTHEKDALMGAVRDVFKDRSTVNGVYPLCDGIVSLLFCCVRSQLPPSIQGWSVGTLEIQP